LILSVIFAVVVFLLIGVTGILQVWEMKTLDLRFKLRFKWEKNPYESPSIAQVNVDEGTYEITHRNFLPRSQYGEIVGAIAGAGAKVIASDIYFIGITDSSEDAKLVSAVSKAKSVISPVVFYLKGEEDNIDSIYSSSNLPPLDSLPIIPVKSNQAYKVTDVFHPPLPGIWENSIGYGFVNSFIDFDGVLRRYPLYMEAEGRAFPSLALQAVCSYLDCPLSQLEIYPGKYIKLSKVKFSDEETAFDIKIPIDKRGAVLIDYLGTWENGFEKIYSAADVLQFKDNPDTLSGYLGDKIVVFAEVSNRSGDLATIPLQGDYPKSAVYMNVINSILERQFIRESSYWSNFALYSLMVIILLALCVNLSITFYTFCFIFITALYIFSALFLFVQFGTVIPIVNTIAPATLVYLFTSVFKFHYEEKYRLILERGFKCYLNPALLKKIGEDADFLKLGGERKNVVVFFSDIRKYSLIAERMEPAELLKFMNRYFSAMVEVAFKYDGTVDKFTGDELMVVFGAPYSHPDDPLRALKMTFEMQEQLEKFNQEIAKDGHKPLSIGIGLHYGDVVAGNLGSEQRMDYSIVGDVINKASRIVSRAGAGEIKISQSYYDLIKDYVEVEKMDTFAGKPGEAEIQTYLIKSAKV
jgi:adenylate cyclase